MDQDVPDALIEAGRGYEALFVPSLFEVWTKHLVEGAGIAAGSHVLDVACGTGVLARDALAKAGHNGRVVGADPAPGMLAAAHELEPGIEWLLCDAETLDVEDEAFDCVVSQFGMMFFDDREKAAQEMYRALKPGGSLALAVWRSVDHNPAYADIIRVLEEHVGPPAADALRLPYSLGDAEEVAAALNSGGFDSVLVETKTEVATFPSARRMVEAELRGWLPLFDIFLGEEEIEAVLIESDRLLKRYAGPAGEAVFPTSAHIFTAQKT
jgi:SAM-dependent methyltransferase